MWDVVLVVGGLAVFGVLVVAIFGLVRPSAVPFGRTKDGAIRGRWSLFGIYAALALGCFVVFVIGGVNSTSSSSSNRTPAATSDVVAEKDAAPSQEINLPTKKADAAELVKTSEVHFKDLRKSEEKLTELQFQEFAATLVGKKVKWIGWVREVGEGVFGDVTVSIDMDRDSSSSMPELSLTVEKSEALALEKGSLVFVTGSINQVSGGMWISVGLDDARISQLSN